MKYIRTQIAIQNNWIKQTRIARKLDRERININLSWKKDKIEQIDDVELKLILIDVAVTVFNNI